MVSARAHRYMCVCVVLGQGIIAVELLISGGLAKHWSVQKPYPEIQSPGHDGTRAQKKTRSYV